MMKQHNNLWKLLLAGFFLNLLLSGCLISMGPANASNADTNQAIKITLKDAYPGVKDGNVESVPLPRDSAYVTVEACIENLSATEQSTEWRDVYIITEANTPIFAIALGYDQAEAFSWLLPIAEPIGAKSIDHKFYFFRIQDEELMRIPAFQSVGCKTSSQYKSLAFLFILPNEMAGQEYTLHFLEETVPFAARQTLLVAGSVLWGGALGFILISIVLAVFVVRKKRSIAKVSPVDTSGQDSPGEL